MSRMMHLFRKYQYILLVVFGVLLMIVFVVGDALQSLSGGGPSGGGRDESVVLKWKNGRVTDNDLYNERARHRIAMEYLQAIRQETLKREGTPKGSRIFLAQNDGDLIRKLLLAEKAKLLGLTVDNDAIYAYLRQLGDLVLDKNDFAVLFTRTVGSRMSQPQMMEQLEQEILAQQMLMMMRDGLFAIPPREAWEMHNRLRRRVQTEMVALKVDDFKDKVPGQPSEAQITAMYEEGKDRFPNPNSPEVGFRRRRKVAFEYIRSDFDKFQQEQIARIKPEITDEDIETHYNDNKERYRALDLPGDDETEAKPEAEGTPPESEGESGSETPGSEDKEAAKSKEGEDAAPAPKESPPPSDPAPSDPASSDPAPSDPAPSDPAPSDPAPSDPAPSDPASSDPAPSDPAPSDPAKPAADGDKPPAPEPSKSDSPPAEKPEATEPEATEPEKPAEAQKQDSESEPAEAGEEAASDSDADGCLGAQEEAEATAEETPAAADTPAAAATDDAPAPPASEPAPADKKPTTENPPASSQPAAKPEEKLAEPPASSETSEKPGDKKETTEPAKTAAEGATAAGDARPDETSKDDAPEEPKYKPLDDKLREEIRDDIAEDRARKPAQDKLDEALQVIESAIEKYGRQLRLLEIDPDAKKPEPVDYEALAAEYGLTAGKIDLVDPLGIEEYELGKSFQMDMSMRTWPPARFPFSQIAYRDDWQVYRTARIKGAELNIEFLYWKTDEEESFVPELEDVRDEIIDAWKKQEAFLLAKAEAEKLAEEVGDKSLGEVVAEREGLEVIEPPEFSWMTVGMTPFGGGGQPSLSTVEGVEGAGNDFMQAVFGLKPGESGVAVNQAETDVYVVRIASESPPEEFRREQFLISGVTPEMQGMASNELFELWDGWYDDLEKELKVVWNN